MVSKWFITYLQMGHIGVITHLLTIDPNFQRDIQVDTPNGSFARSLPFLTEARLTTKTLLVFLTNRWLENDPPILMVCTRNTWRFFFTGKQLVLKEGTLFRRFQIRSVYKFKGQVTHRTR